MCAVLVATAAAPVHASGDEGGTGLAAALYRLASTRRVELLFDEGLVAGKRYSLPDTKSTVEQALTQILKDTGLTFRKLPSGAYVIVAGQAGGMNEPAASVAAPPVADILVIGRRTLDTDIRRGADDPQPYRTSTSRVIADTQPASVDEFLKTQLAQNAQTLSLNQSPFGNIGSVRSQVDLRGLGTAQTLVLINGRRLPSVPGLGTLEQPDVNGLPLNSIDRIETLASTAGGIFGIGAAGGAVNLITKNDFDDATLVLRSSISQKGDAGQRLVDAHVGYTTASGHTLISMRYTRSSDDGLTAGSRPFLERSRMLRYERLGSADYLPVSAGINIVSASGANLSLLPSLGGQSLGASSTYLPAGAPSLSAGGASALLTNAGQLDLTLAPDGQGAAQSLLTPSTTNAVMATARQEIGSALQIYADYLRLSTEGRAVTAAIQTTTNLAVGQSGNPFAQAITITYPAAGVLGEERSRTLTDRITIGAVLRLGGGWVANLDGATGKATVDQQASDTYGSNLPINAFAGAVGLADQLSHLIVAPSYRTHATNRLRDINFRIAGPLFTLPAGPVSATLTGELRDERAPPASAELLGSTPAQTFTTLYPNARQTVGSIFAEARVPLIRDDGIASPVRGLTAQLAVRSDRYELAAPIMDSQVPELATFGDQARNRGTVTAVTASLRAKPIDGVILRASFANGYTPPTQSQITPSAIRNGFALFTDPKRPKDALLSSIPTLYLFGGLPDLRPQHSTTWSFGAIVRPAAVPGLRLSADFSILRTDHEITDFALAQFQYFVTNEALYPGRITRAPLSASDIAAGYTAGRIAKVNATYLSTGASTLNTLDLAVDYERDTAIGRLRAFGQASWEPKLRRGALHAGSYNAVNALNGPLSIRASGGAELSRGPWSVGLTAQAYGSYRITNAAQPGSLVAVSYTFTNPSQLVQQGASHIPAQAYVDAWTSFLAGGDGTGSRPTVTYRFGIKNILNKAPPLVVPPSALFDGIGYSPLGDPRGRRFEIEVTTKFR